MKTVDVIVVQELACFHIEERVHFRRSARGHLQHHGLKTEDGLKSSKSSKSNQKYKINKQGIDWFEQLNIHVLVIFIHSTVLNYIKQTFLPLQCFITGVISIILPDQRFHNQIFDVSQHR